jgi:L-threonylcarbamoyladenylate synthase
LKRDPIDPQYLEELKEASNSLKNGGVLLYPADSIWGLGCDAKNHNAIEKIFRIKDRPGQKSLITLVSDYRQLQQCVAEIPSAAEDILEFSNEPITIIYPSANSQYQHLTAEDGSIAVRMITKGYPYDLMQKSNCILTSTSVNKSGEPSPSSFDEISEEMVQSVDFVANPHFQGILSGRPSKIIKLKMDGTVKIIR